MLVHTSILRVLCWLVLASRPSRLLALILSRGIGFLIVPSPGKLLTDRILDSNPKWSTVDRGGPRGPCQLVPTRWLVPDEVLSDDEPAHIRLSRVQKADALILPR